MGEFLTNHNRGLLYRQESIVERIHVPIFEPLFLELQHFTDCIIDHETPPVCHKLIRQTRALKRLRLFCQLPRKTMT